MANLFDKIPEDFKKQLEHSLDVLTIIYSLKDSMQDKMTPQLSEELNKAESRIISDGVIPFLKESLEPILKTIRFPVSFAIDYKPKTGLSIEARKDNGTKAAAVIKPQITSIQDPKASAYPSPKKILPSFRITQTVSEIDKLRAHLENYTLPPKPQQPQRKYYHSTVISKAPPTGLRVNIGNGNVIHNYIAADTFAEAIAYAVEQKGIDKVVDTIRYYGLYLDGEPLVKNGRFKAEKASDREVFPGYYTNTHVNNAGKQRLLQRISDILNLHWTIQILEKRI